MNAILLDLDGTLVDSVYQHVSAWSATLKAFGYDVPQWRIHAGIGMGSDRLLPWLLGRHVDDADELAAGHKQRFLDVVDTLRPADGALELLDDLERRDVPMLIATSAGEEEREVLLETLGRPDLVTTDSDDVGSSKPHPALLRASCQELGVEPQDAVMVGDAPWDMEAAQAIGARSIGVRTGGFAPETLRAAGAFDVVDAPRGLVGRL